jgi:hypothetical protein
MDTQHSDEAIVQAALDALLLVVAKSADDLRNFHDTLSKLRIAGRPPFPRTVVATTESIIHNLTTVEEQLKKVTVAAGL